VIPAVSYDQRRRELLLHCRGQPGRPGKRISNRPSAFSPSAVRSARADLGRAEAIEKSHGRIETRRIETTAPLQAAVGRIYRITGDGSCMARQPSTPSARSPISPRSRLVPADCLRFRGRAWGSGAPLHCALDVTCREDHASAHVGHAPYVLAAFRNTALTLKRRLGYKLAEGFEHFAEHLLAATWNCRAFSAPRRTEAISDTSSAPRCLAYLLIPLACVAGGSRMRVRSTKIRARPWRWEAGAPIRGNSVVRYVAWYQGISTVLPVVFRASSAACARAASFRLNVWLTWIFTTPLPTTSNRSAATRSRSLRFAV